VLVREHTGHPPRSPNRSEVFAVQPNVPCGHEDLAGPSWVVDSEVPKAVCDGTCSDDPENRPSGVKLLASSLAAIQLVTEYGGVLPALLHLQRVGGLSKVVVVRWRPAAEPSMKGGSGRPEWE
jgi:hypothetical protein